MNRVIRKIRRILSPSFTGLIILQIAAAALFFAFDNGPVQPEAQKGVFDLTEWDENRGGPVKLDGQWEFYWQRQLEYEDWQRNPELPPDLFAAVPDEWNGYSINGTNVPASGYGTYRLAVKVKEADRKLSLKVMPLSTAYRIYVNDRLLATGGQAGQDKDEFRAHGRPETVEFTPPGRTFELIVQVSNFNYSKGGMNRSLILGSPGDMQVLNQKLVYKDLFLLGSLVIACFYSLSMFFMNREEKVSLYFALVCVVFICRIPLSSSYTLYEMFPSVSINTTEWINYTTYHGGILVYALMIREFFPGLFSNRARRFLIVLTLIIIALLVVLPLGVYSRFYLVSDVVGLAALAYPYYVAVRAAVARKPYSWLIFFGNGLLFALVVADLIDVELNKYEWGYFSNYGFFVFIFVYAFILARRFSMSFKEAKMLSRRLLELDKLKDEFLANTSHELKTPLQGIISITESLIDGVEGPLNKGQSRNLDLVASSGRRLANLINDILDISKLKHGDIRLSRKNVHIRPLTEFILPVFRQMYPNKRIEWIHNIPQDLPPVFADENRLVQILYNLIGNAAKFTDKGEVKVTAEERSGNVEITVSDTGIGIRPEQTELIFQAFAQADATIVREYGGVGLGLSITKHLVELHGGQVAVAAAPGEGCRFTVTLPAGDRHATESAEDPSAFGMPLSEMEQLGAEGQPYRVVQSGEHILAVDDDRANLQSAVNLLKLEGYTVTAAADGRQAVEAIRANPDIGLVILDVMMPALSGYEVCRIIRETKSPFELPVLMVTAKHQPEDLVLGFNAGANDFLVKPFEPMEFKARVSTLIELNRSMNKVLQAEIAFLQAQIKPHFLYNTLNTISYFCTRDGAKAKEILNHFAAYLRSGFDFKSLETYVSLAKELEFVNTYLEIEKARFGDRLQTVFDVEEAARSIKIPPLILQPLVENAILHGTMKRIEGGLVEISVKRRGQDVEFKVSDTGVGIAAAKLDELLSDKGERGVGFRNIHMRLQNMYGSGLRVSSVEGRGTEVGFTIPQAKEEAS